MEVTRVIDINAFLKKTEIELERAKSEGRREYYITQTLFGSPGYADDFRLYFSGKGYRFEMKKCGCAEPRYDFILFELR